MRWNIIVECVGEDGKRSTITLGTIAASEAPCEFHSRIECSQSIHFSNDPAAPSLMAMKTAARSRHARFRMLARRVTNQHVE